MDLSWGAVFVNLEVRGGGMAIALEPRLHFLR